MMKKFFFFFINLIIFIKLSESVELACEINAEISCTIEGFFGSKDELDEVVDLIEEKPKLPAKALTLKFENSKFEKFPEEISEYFPKIKKLYIDSVGLKSINRKFLKNFKNLREVHASNNKLTKIPADLFDYTRRITHLYFNGNRINSLDIGSILSLKNLKVLELKENKCIDKIFNMRNEKESTDLSTEVLQNCQMQAVPLDMSKRRCLMTWFFGGMYKKKKERKRRREEERRRREQEERQRRERQQAEQKRRQQEEQRRRQQAEQKRKQQEAAKQKQLKEEARRKAEVEEKKKIERLRLETQKKEEEIQTKFKEIIKETWNFKIERINLLIENYKIILNYVNKLTIEGVTKDDLKTKLKAFMAQMEKEMQGKFEIIIRQKVENLVNSTGIKEFNWKSIEFPTIEFSKENDKKLCENIDISVSILEIIIENMDKSLKNFENNKNSTDFNENSNKIDEITVKIIETGNNKAKPTSSREFPSDMTSTSDGVTIKTSEEDKTDSEDEKYSKIKISSEKSQENQLKMKMKEEAAQICQNIQNNYFKLLKNYILELKTQSHLTNKEFLVKTQRLKLEIEMKNELKELLSSKLPKLSSYWCQALIDSINLSNMSLDLTENSTDEFDTSVLERCTENLIKYAIIKMKKLNKNLEFQQKVNEWEVKIMNQLNKFQKTQQQLVNYYEELFKMYKQKMEKLDNSTRDLQLKIMKGNLMLEMKEKYHKILEEAMEKCIKQVKEKMGNSKWKFPRIKIKKIKFPSIESYRFTKFEFPDMESEIKSMKIKFPEMEKFKMPEFPEMEIVKFKYSKFPELEFPSLKPPEMPELPVSDRSDLKIIHIESFKFPEFSTIKSFKLPSLKIIKNGEMEMRIDGYSENNEDLMEIVSEKLSKPNKKELEINIKQINMAIEEDVNQIRIQITEKESNPKVREVYEKVLRNLEIQLKQQSSKLEEIREKFMKYFIKILLQYKIKLTEATELNESEIDAKLNIIKADLDNKLALCFQKVINQLCQSFWTKITSEWTSISHHGYMEIKESKAKIDEYEGSSFKINVKIPKDEFEEILRREIKKFQLKIEKSNEYDKARGLCERFLKAVQPSLEKDLHKMYVDMMKKFAYKIREFSKLDFDKMWEKVKTVEEEMKLNLKMEIKYFSDVKINKGLSILRMGGENWKQELEKDFGPEILVIMNTGESREVRWTYESI